MDLIYYYGPVVFDVGLDGCLEHIRCLGYFEACCGVGCEKAVICECDDFFVCTVIISPVWELDCYCLLCTHLSNYMFFPTVHWLR